uniref:ATP synthase c subunit lysine N-methyltransferase n=1 Tax=Sphenodon punctatus TaxID=8508 RepID=A0A8D0GV36_SPHPU
MEGSGVLLHQPKIDAEAPSLARKRNWGLVVTGAVSGTLVALYAIATPFIIPALRKICLPFVPVIAAAKEGFRAVGYELNPWLVWYSRYYAWREGVYYNATFYISDLWKANFSQYTNVVVFGVPQMVSLFSVSLTPPPQICIVSPRNSTVFSPLVYSYTAEMGKSLAHG